MTMSQADKNIQKFIQDEATVARFKAFLEEKPNGCIEYSGARTSKGYGVFGLYHGDGTRTHTVKAHRFSFALHYGFDKLPHGTDTTQNRKVVHHMCENKSCVNPLHLESVTDRFNLGITNDKNMF